MTKKILIIVGIVIVIVVIGVWLYIFLTGKTATDDDTPAQFGDGGDYDGAVVDPFDFEQTGELPTAPQRLRQLTLRPVAGAGFSNTGILYVEQGTGHIYHINLESGNETLISGTTIVGTRDAVFSTGGTYVAITLYEDGIRKTIVGSVSGNGNLIGVSLPENATEIAFGENENVLFYLLEEPTGSRGYVYDIGEASASELFNIPIRDVHVLWGEDLYVYTTPSLEQVGYIYSVVGQELGFVTTGAAGLVAFDTPNGPMVAKGDEYGLTSKLVLEDSSVLFGELIPEKCVSTATVTLCAVPRQIKKNSFPDSWYQGMVSYRDDLWKIDLENGTSEFILDLLEEGGREIDVFKIGTNESGDKFWFVNKNNNTLWLFDSTL